MSTCIYLVPSTMHYCVTSRKMGQNLPDSPLTHSGMRSSLQFPLRHREPPSAVGLRKHPPSRAWTEYNQVPMEGVLLSKSCFVQPWRHGRAPSWWIHHSKQAPPPPIQLTPAMQAQVDGVLGQLRALLAKSLNRMVDTFRNVSRRVQQPAASASHTLFALHTTAVSPIHSR